MFHPKYAKSQVINTCPGTSIFNYCDQNYVSGDTFMVVEMMNIKKILGFRFIFKKSPIVIYDITK